MEFEGPRDWICAIAAVILIIMGALTFFGISIPFLTYIVAAAFIIGALAGIADAFTVFSDIAVMGIIYMLLFLIILIMGISAFFAIPIISGVIALVPLGLTHYVVNVIVAVLLLAVAFQSD